LIDRLHDALERSRYGPWTGYGVLAVGMALVLHLALWIPGALTFPKIRLPIAFTGAFSSLSLAARDGATKEMMEW